MIAMLSSGSPSFLQIQILIWILFLYLYILICVHFQSGSRCKRIGYKEILLQAFSRTVSIWFWILIHSIRSNCAFWWISHPDKNPDPESKKLFVKIATAYEVLTKSLIDE